MTKTVISLVLFFVSFVLLSYKLDYGSLEPWDEAWYAEVSRNVLRGDIFIMKSNGSTYIDHPPLGYWIEGLFFKVLGESEYSARLPSVIFGCLTIVLVFLLGSKISGMKAGLAAVLILFTSRWFLLRSRTGNLEPCLMFLQLSAVYLSWDAKKVSRIYLAWFLFGLSFLVKTFASVTLLPLMVYNTALFHKYHPLSAENIRSLILFFIVPTGTWYVYNTVIFGRWFIDKNIFTVGLRRGDTNGLTWSNISSTLLLLRSVIHRWFTPFILSYLLSFLLFFRKLDIKRLFIYFIFMFIPYIISSQTKSWHLIPLTVPIALLIACFLSEFAEKFTGHSQRIRLVALSCIFMVATISFKEFIPEAYGKNTTPSDQKVIGGMVKNLPGPVYLDTYKNLEPTVFYYSDRKVLLLNENSDYSAIGMKRPYTFITGSHDINISDCQLITSIGKVKVIHCS